MNITCPHCKTKLNLPDHKIPKNRGSSFKCPKCRESVQLKASQFAEANGDGTDLGSGRGKTPVGQTGGFGRGSQAQALVCMPDSAARTRVMEALTRAGLGAQSPESSSKALAKLQYHIYPLILVDKTFDENSEMMRHMNDLDMSLRRRICLVHLGEKSPTGDAMAALHGSCNFYINTRDLDLDDGILDDTLATAITDHKNFYTIYNDSMRAAGKA